MILTRAVLAAVVVAVCLGGCSEDDPVPNIADPTSSAPTASATSTASVSASPTAPLALAPRETVDAWLAAWTVAMQTGNVTEVSALSTPECESCGRLIHKVSDLYAKGGHLETDGWRATRVGLAPYSVDESPTYVMKVVQARQVLYNAQDQVVDDTDRTAVPMRMTFLRPAGTWLLSRLEILE